MSSRPHIVVIAIDRLGSGWLGPYGNTWVETPALNCLAAESLLSEFAISDAHDLATVYRSYWSGTPSWQRRLNGSPAIAQLARSRGYETLLVTDAEEVAHHPQACDFEHIDLLAWRQPARTADDPRRTRAAEVLTAAGEALAPSAKPKFLWVHAAAMNAAWDAPLELRERMAADDDPQPQQFVEPPSLVLAHDYNPDQLLGIVQAYAAEVMSIDECLASFHTSIAAVCDPDQTLLIVTSPRGYALGEHLLVGSPGDGLRGELLQVPLLVRLPGGVGKLSRISSLLQPADVSKFVAAALAGDLTCGMMEAPAREVAIASSKHELAFRTEHWFYRQTGDSDQRLVELYSKPDDRWEVNEVSQRAMDVVAAFDELTTWVQASRELPDSPNLPALPETITDSRR
jgi:arylsulfatase A-like enzyme